MKSKTRILSSGRHRRFCEALGREMADRRRVMRWWTSISTVADRLGMDQDDAVLLAQECERAGLVTHDLSSTSTRHRHGRDVPHSVTLTEAGRQLVKKR